LNPGRRGGKPATNRLSYGAAYVSTLPTLELILPLIPLFQNFKPLKFYFAGLRTHSTIHSGDL
jgi:hypothetical protein